MSVIGERPSSCTGSKPVWLIIVPVMDAPPAELKHWADAAAANAAAAVRVARKRFIGSRSEETARPSRGKRGRPRAVPAKVGAEPYFIARARRDALRAIVAPCAHDRAETCEAARTCSRNPSSSIAPMTAIARTREVQVGSVTFGGERP